MSSHNMRGFTLGWVRFFWAGSGSAAPARFVTISAPATAKKIGNKDDGHRGCSSRDV